MPCLPPIISQIAPAIQGQGASLFLSRHSDVHSDLCPRADLKQTTPAHGEGNSVDKCLSEVEQQMLEVCKPRARPRGCPPASGSEVSMSEERLLQTDAQPGSRVEAGLQGCRGWWVALGDVRNAEDRTCPHSPGDKPNPMVLLPSLFNTDVRACPEHPLGEM